MKGHVRGKIQGLWNQIDLFSNFGSGSWWTGAYRPPHMQKLLWIIPNLQHSHKDSTAQHGWKHWTWCLTYLINPSFPSFFVSSRMYCWASEISEIEVGYLAKTFIGLTFHPSSSKGETGKWFFKISHLKKKVMQTLHFIHDIMKLF